MGLGAISLSSFTLSYSNLIILKDIIAQDVQNHGIVFCPIILGSDKTYPLYMSNGLIHNNVRRGHRNGVALIALLAIPKSK